MKFQLVEIIRRSSRNFFVSLITISKIDTDLIKQLCLDPNCLFVSKLESFFPSPKFKQREREREAGKQEYDHHHSLLACVCSFDKVMEFFPRLFSFRKNFFLFPSTYIGVVQAHTTLYTVASRSNFFSVEFKFS